MCGIAGILTRSADAGLAARLPPVARALRHRGPDGCGTWVSPSGRAALVHTRLAIFDASDAAAQPMSIGPLTMVYNGAIYNFLELRRELEAEGVVWRSRSDTEVLLRLFEREGVAGFVRLRGMFALAIWDEVTGRCVLARDRFGIKPLYVADDGVRLVFASEVRAIRATGLVRSTVNSDAVYGYFRTGTVPEPATILQAVRMLEPGSHVTWENGRVATATFASAWPSTAASSRTTSGEVAHALRDSVRAHLSGDVPVGVFLSGGTDSTALLSLASAVGPHPVPTLTMSLPGRKDDEGPAARSHAARFRANHAEVAITAATARAAVGPFLKAIDQPSIDGLNSYVMARLASERGIKTVLSGVGSDELFGGYPTFNGVPRLAAWHARAARLGPLASGTGRLIEAMATDPRARRVGDLLQQPPNVSAAYAAYRGMFTRREAARLTQHFTGAHPQSGIEVEESQAETGQTADEVTQLELTRYLRNQLLRDADAMGMAFGVEIRTPFLDAPLVSTLAGLPAGVRTSAGKALLHHAVSGLPPTPPVKLCFQFPFATWLGSEWADVAAVAATVPGVRLDSWYRTWSVYVLAEWMKEQGMAPHA